MVAWGKLLLLSAVIDKSFIRDSENIVLSLILQMHVHVGAIIIGSSLHNKLLIKPFLDNCADKIASLPGGRILEAN